MESFMTGEQEPEDKRRLMLRISKRTNIRMDSLRLGRNLTERTSEIVLRTLFRVLAFL
jgi:hypothetical protein